MEVAVKDNIRLQEKTQTSQQLLPTLFLLTKKIMWEIIEPVPVAN